MKPVQAGCTTRWVPVEANVRCVRRKVDATPTDLTRHTTLNTNKESTVGTSHSSHKVQILIAVAHHCERRSQRATELTKVRPGHQN